MFPKSTLTTVLCVGVALLPGFFVGLTTTSARAGLVVVCDSQPATITGTPGADTLTGTAGPDVIAGLGGNDQIDALGGDDVICGNDGNDGLSGSAGSDRLFGDDGLDSLSGGRDDDSLWGGNDHDGLYGGDGEDDLQGGGDGDFFSGGSGGDLMVGGMGVEDFVSYYESKRGVVADLRPGGGADDGNASDGPAGSRDELRSMEDLGGTSAGDKLYGNSKTNFLQGGPGQDMLFGRAGDDLVDVLDDDDADIANCGGGRDVVRYDVGLDSLRGCEAKNARMRVGDDADALHAAWSRAVVPDAATGSRVEPPAAADYRMGEFAVVDPTGNLVRVGAHIA